MSFNKELGRRIKEERNKRGITGKKSASKAGVSASFLSEVERGISSISVEKLNRIANVFGVGIQKLILKDNSRIKLSLEEYIKLSKKELDEFLSCYKSWNEEEPKIYPLLLTKQEWMEEEINFKYEIS